ncbi:hypothetical protein Daesc_002985 [Daldinia eschscholtzii]|uniref:Uncharacterized protein n=1 Tax=Daldinia eschscholtzii TaxID=292717 RepID=A0AAX6MT47_9PEZI
MPHIGSRSGKSSSPDSRSSKNSESTHSSTPRKTIFTGDNRVSYAERIRALRRRSKAVSAIETRPANNVGLMPPSMDPREPRPSPPPSPSVLSMLVNSSKTTDTESSLHNLRLSLGGLTYDEENDDHLFDRLAHDKEEAAVNKRYSDSANERQRKRSSLPATPSPRRVALALSPEIVADQFRPFDDAFKNSSGENSDKSSEKRQTRI